ncbi:hypothetical protein B0T18DRAFT_432192 [Schizothecium vesticola]|uniref:Uncharacterized protein n=1 Tax=Schizothecium vesticola TaxID=314040 RepID=A0AA40JZW8_9PEZI|nr:hypothetical protein B0T18DRAFT_432192 [Schizothecium vesticola]
MSAPAVRSRRPFHYPEDNSSSSDDDTPSIMDEQEQESYIRTLTTLNATRNKTFTHLLLLLPLLASIPHFLALFRTTAPLLPLLALTSLASTAYLLITLPPTKTGIAVLDSGSGGYEGDGPLARYLPYLVPALATAVAVAGWVRGAGAGEGWWLPGVVFGATVVAKVVMGGVDPGELEGLRYGYKGA